MTSRQTVVDREMFVQALRHMGEQDLLFLNRMVVPGGHPKCPTYGHPNCSTRLGVT